MLYKRSGSSVDCSFVTNVSASTSSQTQLISRLTGRMGMHLYVGLNGAHQGRQMDRKVYYQSIMCRSHLRMLSE